MMQLYQGDCLEVMRGMADNSVDAIVTDPPYGIRFMGRRWDYDVPSIEVWAECLRILKPGGHLLSFGGSRTYHRMAVNVEDGGFEIRDCVMWCYSSGFPKSLDVGKALDKKLGAEREVVGERQWTNAKMVAGNGVSGLKQSGSFAGEYDSERVNVPITAPATPQAKQWDGWGTALKPAYEPIIVARKPLDGAVAQNILTWGVGGINIEACRVSIDDGATMARNNKPGDNGWKNSSGGANNAALNGEPSGRWPANLMHDGSDEVMALFPDTKSGMMIAGQQRRASLGKGGYHGDFPDTASQNGTYGDEGSAARFFYCAKASPSEREIAGDLDNDHPTVKPLALMTWLVTLVASDNAIILDPFMGSGTTGVACVELGRNFIGTEKDAHYFAIAKRRIETAERRASGQARKGYVSDYAEMPLFAEVSE